MLVKSLVIAQASTSAPWRTVLCTNDKEREKTHSERGLRASSKQKKKKKKKRQKKKKEKTNSSNTASVTSPSQRDPASAKPETWLPTVPCPYPTLFCLCQLISKTKSFPSLPTIFQDQLNHFPRPSLSCLCLCQIDFLCASPVCECFLSLPNNFQDPAHPHGALCAHTI